MLFIFSVREPLSLRKLDIFHFVSVIKKKEQSEIVSLYDLSDYVSGYMYCVKINPRSIKKNIVLGITTKYKKFPGCCCSTEKNVPGVSIENEVVQTNIRTCVRITTILRICIVSNTPSMLFSRPKCNRSPWTNHQQPSDQEYPVHFCILTVSHTNFSSRTRLSFSSFTPNTLNCLKRTLWSQLLDMNQHGSSQLVFTSRFFGFWLLLACLSWQI